MFNLTSPRTPVIWHDLGVAGTDLASIPECPLLPGVTVPVWLQQADANGRLESCWKERRELILLPSLSHAEGVVADEFSLIGCASRILSLQSHGGSQTSLVIQGLHRVQLQKSVTHPDGLCIETLYDHYPHEASESRTRRRQQLLDAFEKTFATQPADVELVLNCETPFGQLCDLLAFSCRLNPDEYLQILSEVNVDKRSELVLAGLLQQSERTSAPCYAPHFSSN